MTTACMSIDELATTTTYEDCRLLIYDTVWNFIHYYGLPRTDFEELASYANLRFMEAYRRHKTQDSNFSTWVRKIIWHGLQDQHKNQRRRERSAEKMPAKPPYVPGWVYVDLIDELGYDAKCLLQLFRETPMELDDLLNAKKCGKPTKRLIFRLLKKTGWTRKKINNSLRELEHAFNI